MKKFYNFKKALLSGVFLSLFSIASFSQGYPDPVAYYLMTGEAGDTIVMEDMLGNDGFLFNYNAEEDAIFVPGEKGNATEFQKDTTDNNQKSNYMVSKEPVSFKGNDCAFTFWMEWDTTNFNGWFQVIATSHDYNEANAFSFVAIKKSDPSQNAFRIDVRDSLATRRRTIYSLSADYSLPDLTAKEWVHIAIVNTLDSMVLYINNQNVWVNHQTWKGFNSDGTEAMKVTIGGLLNNSGNIENPFNGKIDEVMFFDQGLDTADIRAIMELQSPVAKIKAKDYKLTHYPNPAKDLVTISYELQNPGYVTLEIFNLSGQKVKTLINHEYQPAAENQRTWNCTNNSGQSLPAGMYFYRLTVDNKGQGTGKMIIAR